jgi:hypothetical protein
MAMYERLYDETEQAKVRFVGFISEHGRYDFGIVYTNMFFGKPLVVCMQTGRSSLLAQDDIENLEYLQKLYNLRSIEEAEEVSIFFRNSLPTLTLEMEAESS